MNEEDYDFDSAGNSRLSSLFKRDNEGGVSSLVYKAPKPPTKVSNPGHTVSTQTFHKYINLTNMSQEQILGRYIIAIINSNQTVPEILVYQTKNNIFIRTHVKGKLLYGHTDKTSLILIDKSLKFKIEFEKEQDMLEFKEEYVRYGGIIDLSHEITYSLFSDDNINEIGLKSEIISSETLRHSRESDISHLGGNEKSKIDTYLEKIGLSLPFPSNKEDSNALFQDSKNIHLNSHNNSSDRKNIHDVTDFTQTKSIQNSTKEDVRNDIKLPVTENQAENLISVLISNQTDNYQLREAIISLTATLKDIIPSKELSNISHTKKLESKIKALELKNENLQSELNCYYKKHENIDCNKQISSIKEMKNLNDVSCQTSFSESSHNDEKSLIIKILTIMKSLPMKTNETDELKKIKDDIQDEALRLTLESYFTSIEEIGMKRGQINGEIAKNAFAADLKQTMNNMYQNICTSCDNADTRQLIAKEVKLATLDILNTYRNTEEYD